LCMLNLRFWGSKVRPWEVVNAACFLA